MRSAAAGTSCRRGGRCAHCVLRACCVCLCAGASGKLQAHSRVAHLVEPRGLRVGGGVWVGVAEERLDGGQDGGDVVDWAPLVLQNVEADGAVGVD